MATLAINAILTEARTAKASLSDICEGWSDYQDLELSEGAETTVQEQIARFASRNDLLQAVIDAATNLISAMNGLEGDGHPNTPTRDIPDDVYDELAAQERTISAALTTVKRMEPSAVSASVTFSEPTKK